MRREIVYGMPDREYRDAPGVNVSALKEMGSSPAHYYQSRYGRRNQPTAAQVFGTMAHLRILQPELFDSAVAIRPPGLDGRTKEGKAWAAEVGSRQIITVEEFEQLNRIGDAVRNHPIWKAATGGGGAVEVSVFAPYTLGPSVQRKGRIDFVPTNGNAILDIKTTGSGGASKKEFGRAIVNWGYHIQAAYYLDLINAAQDPAQEPRQEFIFVAVEKEPPYAAAAYTLDSEMIRIGRATYTEYLLKVLECEERSQWPSYQDNETMLEVIDCPPYLLRAA
jgi:hypothetical protein